MTATNLGKVMILPRQAYDPAATYNILDLVTYNGSSFVALKTVTGVAPTLPPDNVNWQLSASKGDTGDVTPAAQAAAAAALASQQASENSAAAALASAQAAAISETNADSAATAAGNYANTAGTAAGVATTQAGIATAAETTATTQASIATTQAAAAAASAASVYGDLASTATGKGAALVAYLSGTVKSFLDSLSASGSTVGAFLVGFLQSGANAVARTLQDKGREWVTPDDFTGATDTISVNNALATGRKVRILAGKTYSVTTLNMAVDGTSLEIEAGGVINLTSAVVNGFYITGNNCSITGGGAVNSPASWDGTNSRPTFATVWIAGNNFYINGITFNNIPRNGIHFEDATNWRVENCHIYGNFPYASWTGTNVGHCGIDYNPPATGGSTSDSGNGSGILVGTRIEGCVQGFHIGNYDAAADAVGVVVSGCSFNRCWNHGIYGQLLEGATISGNNFTNCQTPIVADGIGSTVVGNSIYATETTNSNGWAVIYVRDATDTNVCGNTLYGMGAAIYVSCITGTSLTRVNVANNVIHRTANVTGITGSAIRVGIGAQTCIDCSITGNQISGVGYDTLGVIVLTTASTSYQGVRTKVSGNRVYYGDTIAASATPSLVYVGNHDYISVTDNLLICEAVGSGAATVYGVNLNSSSYFNVRGNEFYYTAGGTNINFRGLNVQGSPALAGRITDNEFFCTSGSLGTVNAITFAGGNAVVSRNRIDGTSKMGGTVSWTSGTASVAVSNTNALAAFSRVSITPTSNAAGTVVATPGIKTVITDGTITISTADGSNLASTATFTYTLD